MKTINILFIGDYYTSCNNLPFMVSQLALSASEPNEAFAQAITREEATLEWHCTRKKALKMIGEKRWDFAVLQEQSIRSIEDKTKMYEHAEILDSEIKKSGAETILYIPWVKQDTRGTQEKLTQIYIDLGKKIGARVAPVGTAWANALKTSPELILYGEDKSHPMPTGTYLAACVFYSIFFGYSPVGLTGNIYVNVDINLNLPGDKANLLQSIAWQTVQKFNK
ncbi:MAG: hypothetical protein JW983_02135 [Elusimicrobia bacterium]|nr:hypothetical protein [Elusimicrobiota bacterium]